MTGVELIAAERKRQIEKEGWTQEHDTEHPKGDLALSGACYALDVVGEFRNAIGRNNDLVSVAYRLWPWAFRWWKPTHNDPIRQLVKAGALIAAEIDKLQAEQ